MEVRAESAVPSATGMVRSLHQPADAPFASKEQMVALGSFRGEGDTPPLRVVEHHPVQLLETHSAEFSTRCTLHASSTVAMCRTPAQNAEVGSGPTLAYRHLGRERASAGSAGAG